MPSNCHIFSVECRSFKLNPKTLHTNSNARNALPAVRWVLLLRTSQRPPNLPALLLVVCAGYRKNRLDLTPLVLYHLPLVAGLVIEASH